MQIITLLDDVSTTGTGPVAVIDHQRCGLGGGPIPMVLTGIITASVRLEGAVATPEEVRLGTAVFSPVENALWTADMADGLFVGVTDIRANVTEWTAGTITFKVLI